MSPESESAISVIDIKKTFNNKDYVLKGIDLEIPRGKITLIIGFSGTGKSVLLKNILGLMKPTSGSIYALGKNMSAMDEWELTKFRVNFGVLFQDAALFDEMTVVDNVAFPLREHRRNMSVEETRVEAVKRLISVGMEEKSFHQLPSELSIGMRKRVGLARALALDPEILIYDEPTTGLDPIRTRVVDELIVTTQEHRPGITSVVVTHDLAAAFRFGDFVTMLDSGKVLLTGTPDDFLKSDIKLVKEFVARGVNQQ